jgi:hypothetical protein
MAARVNILSAKDSTATIGFEAMRCLAGAGSVIPEEYSATYKESLSVQKIRRKEVEPMSKKEPTPSGRAKKKAEVSLVRSLAAEYLTFVAASGQGASKPFSPMKMSGSARR